MRKNKVLIRQKTYNSVLLLLDSIFSGKKYPEVVISELFRKEDLSPDEKTVIVGLVYGILRHRGRLDYIIEHASCARITNLAPDILNSIRICAYQAVFTDSRAAGIVNNVVAMSSHNTKLCGFAKRTIEAIIKNKDTVIFPDPPVEYIQAYHSHPRWIVEKWITELGSAKEVEALCCANNMEPPLTIRVNVLKSEIGSLQKKLGEEGYSSSRTGISPFGLIVDKKEGIFKTRAFKEGFFEVQDEGSQLVTLLTRARPGELVIDACAGNGGKSLFLSSLMKNRGTIIASDLSRVKLANLRKRATKAGAFNIKTVNKESLAEFDGKGDCVFIDAPCSGMGVFRRNPDSKWRLTPDDIKELVAKQKEILSEFSRLVKPGGRYVYATCTISKEENEDIVHDFLKENKDFSLVPILEMPGLISEDGFFRSLPHIYGTDGFFGAVMVKRQIG